MQDLCSHLRFLHCKYYPLTDMNNVKNWNWNCMREICWHLRCLHTNSYLLTDVSDVKSWAGTLCQIYLCGLGIYLSGITFLLT